MFAEVRPNPTWPETEADAAAFRRPDNYEPLSSVSLRGWNNLGLARSQMGRSSDYSHPDSAETSSIHRPRNAKICEFSWVVCLHPLDQSG